MLRRCLELVHFYNILLPSIVHHLFTTNNVCSYIFLVYLNLSSNVSIAHDLWLTWCLRHQVHPLRIFFRLHHGRLWTLSQGEKNFRTWLRQAEIPVQPPPPDHNEGEWFAHREIRSPPASLELMPRRKCDFRQAEACDRRIWGGTRL